MKDFFERNESSIMTALIIIFAVLFVAVIVFLFLSSYFKHRYDKHLHNKTRKCYIFVIHLAENEIVYFFRTHPKNQTRMHLDSFYNHILSTRDRDMFRNWVENLFSDSHNLLNEITINLDGRTILPLYFTVDYLEREKKIIHLSSYSVEYLEEVARKRKYFLAPINENKGITIDSVFSKKNGLNALLLFVRFYSKDKHRDAIKQNAMSHEMRQVCYLFLKEKRLRYHIEYDDENSFVICDAGVSNITEMQQVVFSLVKRLNARLEINAYPEDYSFAIGAVETKYFMDGRKCLDVARNKSLTAEHQENKIDWFHLNDNIVSLGAEIWQSEIEIAIKGRKRERKLRYLYQPIVDARHIKTFGYFTICEPENSIFTRLEEMRDKANEIDRTMEFSTVIYRTFINKFYNEVVKRIVESGGKNELRLFLTISSYDIAIITKILSDIRHTKECNLVLIIDETEMNESVSRNYQDTIASLMAIKKKRYEIALLVKDASLPWANSVYDTFDYFIVDKALISGEEGLDSSSSIRRLVPKLLGFHRPMMAVDMDTKGKIQILREKNFTLFAGNAIETANENIIELTSRKINVVKK